jgi:hypothetical protein
MTTATIPIFTQPTPTTTIVSRKRGMTSIARLWADGDEAKCRLCPSCRAADGMCLVTTTRPVADDDAELFAMA